MEPICAKVNGGLTWFEGPGLTRKPRVGEKLVSRTSGALYKVTHFDDRFPSILHYVREDGSLGSLIWYFSSDNTMNRLVTHELQEDLEEDRAG